jgi:hypothetical protein
MSMSFVLRRLVPLLLLALLWAPAAYAWSWPAQGPVLQQFSFDPAHPYAAGQHRGIDIGSPESASVLAPAAGTVTFAGSVPTSGLCVTIGTADGYSVTLTHLGTIAVARGSAVAEGDTVGSVGPSGTPDFDVPYVHLGIRIAGDPNGYLDPLSLLPPVAPPAAPEASNPSAPADSSAPPAATTPAPTAEPLPETAPAAPVADVPAPPPAPTPPALPAPSPSVQVTHLTTGAPVGRATRSTAPAEAARPAPVSADVPVRPRVDFPAAAGRAHAGWRPQRLAETSALVRHRPVPVPASPRERPGIAEQPFPTTLLALGAGGAALAIVALAGIARLRRRPATPPEIGAVVIPLPRRVDWFEERRVA